MRFAKLAPILAILCALAAAVRCPVHTVAAAAQHGESATTRRRAEASNTHLLVCFGDSLTAGAGVEPDQAYPANLQRRLDAAGFHYHVVNLGVGGNTTKDGLNRLPEVLRLHPEVVIVEFGGNDGLRGLPTAQAERNLATIVQTLQSNGAKVALAGITLPPQYGGDYITSFNNMFPHVAERYHVPLLPFILQDVYGVEGDMQPDGIHATAKGNLQVAANIEKLALPLLKR